MCGEICVLWGQRMVHRCMGRWETARTALRLLYGQNQSVMKDCMAVSILAIGCECVLTRSWVRLHRFRR